AGDDDVLRRRGQRQDCAGSRGHRDVGNADDLEGTGEVGGVRRRATGAELVDAAGRDGEIEAACRRVPRVRAGEEAGPDADEDDTRGDGGVSAAVERDGAVERREPAEGEVGADVD